MRPVVVAILVAALAVGICFASQHGAKLERDYVLALGTADRFLAAWNVRDQDRGLKLVSTNVKKRYTESQIREYVGGISNPHHAAFEVLDGKRVKGGFEFRVRLYEHFTAERQVSELPGAARIRLVKVGPEDWRVDNLPGYAEWHRLHGGR